MKPEAGLDIAVIGGGVAGIVAAYLLARRHRVSLYEKNDYVGGHTHTLMAKTRDGTQLPVDTGFIVFNDRTYPHFIKFIRQLGVDWQKSPMSFSYSDRQTGFTYSSAAPFADPKNRLSPSFWAFLLEIVRFNRSTRRLLKTRKLQHLTLGQYLEKYHFSNRFAECYILPMGAAIWSSADRDMRKFPVETFARFFENHGLLSLTNHPQWYTIRGGSHEYVKAFLKAFPGRVFTGHAVKKIVRLDGRIRLYTEQGQTDHDRAVLASHADEAFGMIESPTECESALLSPWRYTDNRVILHRDASLLPSIIKARAAWNYLRENGSNKLPAITMTYYMNILQQLNAADDFCVTLNPGRKISPAKLIAGLCYSHPLFDSHALAAQRDLHRLNKQNDLFFCGSYFRYGFHEDAVLSAVNMAQCFGVTL